MTTFRVLVLSAVLWQPVLAANIAPVATVTASSQNVSTDQQAAKAVDGVVDGFPGDWKREWVTTGQGAGAWLELRWQTPQRIDHVVIYDRINLSEQVTAGRLEFDAGAALSVPALPNNGAPLTLTFPARTTARLRLTVVSTSRFPTNIGLAELEVHTEPGTTTSCACDSRYSPSPTLGWDYDAAAIAARRVKGFNLYVNSQRVATFRCGESDPKEPPVRWVCPPPPFPAIQRYGDWAPGTHVSVQLAAFDDTHETAKSAALDVCMPCVWNVPAVGRSGSYAAAWTPARCPCTRAP